MGYSPDGGISIEARLFVNAGVFRVDGAKVYLSTFLLEKFFKELFFMYGSLSGQACYHPQFEDSLQFQIIALKGGKLQIIGIYQEYRDDFSLMKFEIESNQTFIAHPLKDLKKFLSTII